MVGARSGSAARQSKKHQFQQGPHTRNGVPGQFNSGRGGNGVNRCRLAQDMRHRPYSLAGPGEAAVQLAGPSTSRGRAGRQGPEGPTGLDTSRYRGLSKPVAASPPKPKASRARGLRFPPYRPRWTYLSGNHPLLPDCRPPIHRFRLRSGSAKPATGCRSRHRGVCSASGPRFRRFDPPSASSSRGVLVLPGGVRRRSGTWEVRFVSRPRAPHPAPSFRRL